MARRRVRALPDGFHRQQTARLRRTGCRARLDGRVFERGLPPQDQSPYSDVLLAFDSAAAARRDGSAVVAHFALEAGREAARPWLRRWKVSGNGGEVLRCDGG